ncbi:MAG: signal recognition particle protein [Thermoplasmata archaeon]|nr:MAG: signal recognition particle protein [Thermoplasmata archaeon]
MVLDNLKETLRKSVNRIVNSIFVDRELIRETVKDIQRALLLADVEVSLVVELGRRIEKRALEERPRGLGEKEHVIKVLYEELKAILGKKKELPIKKYRIMLVGLYGQGKTTTAAKIAKYFKKKGLKVGLIQADVHRPAAYEQLKQLAESINVKFYGNPSERDPTKIIREGLKALKDVDVLIVDTSGRHALEEDLIEEMKRIKSELSPDEVWLIIDASIGQKAGEHSRVFHEAVGITGVIVTKMDGSAKGGGALTAVAKTGAPIVFIGVGEKVDDLEHFDPDSFISRLLGMGDIKALIEKVQEVVPEKKAEELTKKILSGRITMNDVYEQLEALLNMGPLKRVLELLPFGFGVPQIDESALEITQEKLKKFKVIIDSMTEEEREDPSIIRGSRITRIARGSGSSEDEVRELLKYYEQLKTFYKSFGRNRKLRRALMRQLKLT